MVQIIPEQERRAMCREEIRKTYNGKWVFMAHVKDSPFSAVPVIIADKPYEGSESGIYTPFKENSRYGVTSYISLLMGVSMMGFEAF